MSDDFSTADLAAIERSTQEVGRHLFDHLCAAAGRAGSPLVGRPDHGLGHADESVKVQMFRFIDVLPMLDASDAVVRHLHEYFRRRAASICRRPCGWAWPWPRRARSPAGPWPIAARRNAMGHARRFIAGTNAGEVLAAAMRERKLQRAFTLDMLGEAVTSEREAERYLQAYLDLIEGIAPTVNAWPEVPQIDRGAARRAAAGQRLDQALGARQPVRPDRSRGHDSARGRAAARAAARCPASIGRSSTSTWSRTARRT